MSGFLTGVTIGVCGSCRLGQAPRDAGPFDPYAMTPRVRAELIRLARRPYHVGLVLGGGYISILVGGLIFHRLNRLEGTRNLEVRV